MTPSECTRTNAPELMHPNKYPGGERKMRLSYTAGLAGVAPYS